MARKKPLLSEENLVEAELREFHRDFPDQIQRIDAKLRKLASIDRDRHVFGAKHHLYRLRAACTAAGLRAVEAALELAVPTDFRRFLAEIVNGGAGPTYGAAFVVDREEDLQDERLRKWNHLPRHSGRRHVAWSAVEAALSLGSHPLDGTILVCHLGCEISAQLVLRGDHPGRLWVDNTGAELACWGSDSDYYEMWLDEGRLGWNWH